MKNMKFTLYTWPDSQEFISNPLCVLVCPPKDAVTRLDSSYMVPITIAAPEGAEKIYVRLDKTESSGWLNKTDAEDNVLFDYNGYAFVEESLYEASRRGKGQSVPAVEALFDVCIAPMTNVKVKVVNPLHPTEEETERIIEAAVDAIQTSGDAYITAENVESIEHYNPETGKKTPVFNSNHNAIEEKLKSIMEWKDQIGEFSVNLFYNDKDKENPFTARLHSSHDKNLCYDASAKSFNVALTMVNDYIWENYL